MLKYDTICFLFGTPILESYYQKYGMDYLEQLGYSIMVFDLSPIVNHLAYETVTTNLINYNKINIIICLTKEKFKEAIHKFNKKIFIVATFDFNMKNYFIYKEISNNKLHYCNLARMDTAIEITTQNNFNLRVKNYLKEISLHKIFTSIFSHLPKKIFHLNTADFIIFGGKRNADLYFKINLCDEHTRIEYIHSFDYEKFLKIKDANISIVREKYCVFIDQYLPYHPDKSQTGFNINADRYYKELRELFNIIENSLNLKVIISVHPRSNYESHPEAYMGYDLRKGYTAELIKNCEFTFTHFSTAVSYAVLFEKPLFFITNEEIKSFPIMQKYIELYSKELGTSYIDISNTSSKKVVEFLNLIKVDKFSYDNYVDNYLKKDFKDTNKYDLFWKRFSELIE